MGREFLDIERSYLHVDAVMIIMAVDPAQLDVIVTDNLLGDTIIDLATAVTGDIGLVVSTSINPSSEYPSMFEPVHDSAPDIAGRGITDPIATISSAALLLTHLEHPRTVHRVDNAVAAGIARCRPGPVKTSEVGDRIIATASG